MPGIKCPICSSENNILKIVSKDHLVLKGNSEDFSVYFCRGCENGFSFPLMTSEELEEYYPDDYNCYKSHKGFSGYIQKLRSGSDIRIIKNFLKEKGKEIFEIGSGSGLFLSLLTNKGYIVSGLEPNISGVRYAKKYFDLDLEKCFFEDFQSSKKFDMILAFHVLEHFSDPVSALNKIKSLLKENGYLFLKVPRLDSWASKLYGKFWHGYDLPRHRVHFTKKGLTDLLKKEGFETVKFKEDFDPLASVRLIEFSASHSGNKCKLLMIFLDRLPYILKLFLAVIFDCIMSPFKSGRISIISRKAE